MTYSSVQCDKSQTTKGQSWQHSLLLPSVHLDAETDECYVEHVINQECIQVNYKNMHFNAFIVPLLKVIPASH